MSRPPRFRPKQGGGNKPRPKQPDNTVAARRRARFRN